MSQQEQDDEHDHRGPDIEQCLKCGMPRSKWKRNYPTHLIEECPENGSRIGGIE